jgi:hypothetical protein
VKRGRSISNLKEFAKRMLDTKVPTIIANRETVYVCLLAIPFIIYAFVQFCLRISYEITDVYNWDTHIYWAVGRGIVNGIAPYTGLFDIKPPGIFLLSAISFKIFDSPAFTNFFQAIVLIFIAATPVTAYFLQSNYKSISKLAFAALAGLLLALYSAERAGEVQTESFGAAFASIAIFAMAMPNFEKRKILWMSVATIGILGACGFKEPFLFVIFGASLILCNDIKTWFYRFLLPAIIAILLGIIILLIFGWFDGFLFYLNHMSSSHISRIDDPRIVVTSSFHRAMDFSKLYNDMNAFSWGLAIALLALLSLPFALFFANSKLNEKKLFIKIAFFGIAFFLASFSVGLGGEYFGHHYAFAVPLYMALVLFLFKNWNEDNSAVAKLGLVSFIFLAIATLNYPNLNLDKRKESCRNVTQELVRVAEYLDLKMDELGIDKYTYIGGNDPIGIFGLTKHSPDGPYFHLTGNAPNLEDSLRTSINRANIVIVPQGHHIYRMLNARPWINQILDEHFTRQQVGIYGFYFRKR